MTLNWQPTMTLGALAALWWLLSGGDATSWVIGVPTVAAAGWAAWRPGHRSRRAISLTGLLRFMPFFIRESLRGGSEVALRTLTPHMRIRPGFASYRTGLVRTDARVFFANCVSLLPGSLAASLEGDRLDIHLLDTTVDPGDELRRLEEAVARIFPETS